MMFLAGLEPLQMTARPEGKDLVIDDMLLWVMILRGRVLSWLSPPTRRMADLH